MLPKSEKQRPAEIRFRSTVGTTLTGPPLAHCRGMQKTPSVDGKVFLWSLSGLVIALIVAAMLYAVGIGLNNITRIGV